MSARRPAGGDARDAGLISLEWLLILAATIVMASLTAVATNRVVDRSSDGIADAHADRVQEAVAAARQVVVDAQRESEQQPPYAARFGGWEKYYELRCLQVMDDFEDTGIKTEEGFWRSQCLKLPSGQTGWFRASRPSSPSTAILQPTRKEGSSSVATTGTPTRSLTARSPALLRSSTLTAPPADAGVFESIAVNPGLVAEGFAFPVLLALTPYARGGIG